MVNLVKRGCKFWVCRCPLLVGWKVGVDVCRNGLGERSERWACLLMKADYFRRSIGIFWRASGVGFDFIHTLSIQDATTPLSDHVCTTISSVACDFARDSAHVATFRTPRLLRLNVL